MVPALMLGAALVAQNPPPVTAELVASVSAAKANEPFLAAVVLRTQPGWHVYWRNPGDAGTATTVDWKLPEGWTAGALQWPVPQRFTEDKSVTFGYEGATLLLAVITPGPKPVAGPAAISATAKWLASGDSKVPGEKTLRLGLSMMPVKSGPHRTWFDRLAAAQKIMPQAPDGWTLEAGHIPGGYVIRAKPPEALETRAGMPTFFPEEPGTVEHGEPQRFLRLDDASFWIGLKKSAAATKPPDRLRGILVAPRGSQWKPGVESVLVDLPLPPG